MQNMTPEMVDMNIDRAKAGIWYRAKRTANPKAYILNLNYMQDGEFETKHAYNMALSRAKKWAKA